MWELCIIEADGKAPIARCRVERGRGLPHAATLAVFAVLPRIISDQLHPVPQSPWVRAASWPKEQRRSRLIFAVIFAVTGRNRLCSPHPACANPVFIAH